ncbi:ABC transporter permease [Rhizobium mongolense]|jgi:ABC-2 type transport system permease protein|uniref:ABC-2 type transport system permease protein n=2 Tax=Rhizobium mongolense TaxID=57676 RepID=A0ABR6IPY6_9HYPH|nr:ABC transporter permease [Rhizobium mongolense]MBB4229937.1 ABC-2 type transport system permease protein [Rhizobium mongolense]TVZ72930.1 ABC-2 type transport system permease protein [Rhizobium mongolense USDA 1844]
MWWTRLKALIVKELLAVLRDPRGRTILIGPPIVQLLVFSYAATLEVRNVDVMLLSRDSGYWGQELVRRIEGSPTFRKVIVAGTTASVRDAIDRQTVTAAIEIGADFSRRIEAGEPADLQVILDGRRSNASQIVSGYITQIVATLSAETPAGVRGAVHSVTTVPRNWFNPNLIFQWFMVPNLIASIALLIGLIVTALSIARERELGTFDQLMVSPLRTHEILIGKLVPPMIIGLFHMTVYILAAIFIFGVPLRGSLLLLYGSSLFYLASVAGLGLFISALSMTQQQAILGAFLFMVPAMLLSGFATPIENMPDWLQPVTLINPLRYFLVIVKGIFLKDIPLVEVWHQTWPLCVIAAGTLSAASWLFRRRLE